MIYDFLWPVLLSELVRGEGERRERGMEVKICLEKVRGSRVNYTELTFRSYFQTGQCNHVISRRSALYKSLSSGHEIAANRFSSLNLTVSLL